MRRALVAATTLALALVLPGAATAAPERAEEVAKWTTTVFSRLPGGAPA